MVLAAGIRLVLLAGFLSSTTRVSSLRHIWMEVAVHVYNIWVEVAVHVYNIWVEVAVTHSWNIRKSSTCHGVALPVRVNNGICVPALTGNTSVQVVHENRATTVRP